MTMTTGKLSVKTAALEGAITVQRAKDHLRIEQDVEEDDEYIRTLIGAVTDYIESVYGITTATKTYEYRLDAFPSETAIWLPRPPLISITSVKYLDGDGTEQTWASSNYTLVRSGENKKGGVELGYDITWPLTRGLRDDVNVEYQAGYGSDPNQVPEHVQLAACMGVSHLYENREVVAMNMQPQRIPFAGSEALHAFMMSMRVWS